MVSLRHSEHLIVFLSVSYPPAYMKTCINVHVTRTKYNSNYLILRLDLTHILPSVIKLASVL